MLQRLARFDQLSFWLGFAAASLFWWLFARIMPAVRQAWATYQTRRAARHESNRSGVELDYRNDFIRYTQGLHLAAPLFSLDEIVITPHILAPPLPSNPGADMAPTDTLSRILPYAPEYPDFTSAFGVERLTLSSALTQGANLALLGSAGAGKTVALAHLGTQIASLSPDAGILSNLVPFYIHAASILIQDLDSGTPRSIICESILEKGYLSRRTASRFENLVELAFSEQRVILLLDGLDELAPASIEQVTEFLQSLTAAHPEARVVAAASPDYYNGLTQLGLIPVSMAGWSQIERCTFIRRWGERWLEHIADSIWPDLKSGVELDILRNWLEQDTSAHTPLEWTLRVWAALAGDSLGGGNTDSLDAYIRRMAGQARQVETALNRIGMQMVLTMRPVAHATAAGGWARGDLAEFTEEDLESHHAGDDVETGGDESAPGRVRRSAISDLLEAGILVRRPGNYVSFNHPVIAGYCAGRGLAVPGGSAALAGQPTWSLRQVAMHYLAACADTRPILSALDDEDPLQSALLTGGGWLRDMQPKAADRMLIMKNLASLFQNNSFPVILRQRAIIVLATSRDTGIYALCKKLIEGSDPIVRGMCALVLGYSGDEKNVPSLIEALSDEVFQVRAAACFALVHIGTQPAIEMVATLMLHGDEDSQRAAAEALALNPEDGYELLCEASKVEDLLVRRAAVFGLARTGRPEAVDLIASMQLEDGQWIVRNAANQAMQQIESGSYAIPRPLPPLHETDWLIHFASQSGEGISPGQSAQDMLLRSLTHGDIEEKLAAMDRYRISGAAQAVPALHKILKNASSELQTAAVLTLQHLGAQGFASRRSQATSPENP